MQLISQPLLLRRAPVRRSLVTLMLSATVVCMAPVLAENRKPNIDVVPDISGKVQTVLGLIEPESLGPTITHEHLIADGGAVWFSEPDHEPERTMAHQQVGLTNLWWVRFNGFSNRDNFAITDENEAIYEVDLFKKAGGASIVDLTTPGHGRDVVKLKNIAKSTGVNVIAATGWYISPSHPKNVAQMSVEQLAEVMIKEIVVGIEDTGIKAGIIGEIGTSSPLNVDEVKVLRAAVLAQKRTGVPINVHPSPDRKALMEMINILKESGADPKRTVISHVDGGAFDFDTVKILGDAGYYLEFDTFGYVHWMRTKAWNTFLPSDTQRIELIVKIAAAGYLNQILLSQDIYFKDVRATYGGYGYGHIFNNIVPAMKAKGMSTEEIDTILIENPKRLLTFVSPAPR